jgi:hypothetical protein
MAKSIQNMFQLFRRIIKKNQNNNNKNIPMMGRWNLDYDNTIQNKKVYWANMDNCGCCDQKIVTVKVTFTHSDQTDSDEYILPYVV